MSFKRDGDDLSMLNMLKHKRVFSLLEEYIPEDEAKLLSNGRLTCLICTHRPIFDTMLMLGNHRKGKKHILELGRYLKHKTDLDREAMKKEQMKSLKLVSLPSPPLLEEAVNLSQRRHRLDFPLSHITTSPILSPSSAPPAHSNSSPKYRVRRYLRTLHRKQSLESVIQHQRENYGEMSDQILDLSTPSQSNLDNPVSPRAGELPKETKNEAMQNPTTTNVEFSYNLSGWIKDKDGKWVKDPNAEFDSDEDTPQ